MVPASLLIALITSTPSGEAPECGPDRMVVAPLEPLALTPADARGVEDELRRQLQRRGYCVESRAATLEKLRRYEDQRLPPCADETCAVGQAVAMGGRWLLTGVVLGVGGKRTASLVLAPDRLGAVRRALAPLEVGREGVALGEAIDALFGRAVVASAANVPPTEVRRSSARRGRWPVYVAAGAGAASLLAGALFGAASDRTARALSEGRSGCGGTGDAYRACFEQKLGEGRSQSLAANVLFGAGAVLAAGAGVMLVVELP